MPMLRKVSRRLAVLFAAGMVPIFARWVAVLFAVGMVVFFLSIMSSKHQSEWVFESESPTNFGSAIFFQQDGFMVTDFTFSVRDYGLPHSKRIALGKWQDRSGFANWPLYAVWSGDGSVMAVRWDKGYSTTYWDQVYDFRTHGNGLPAKLSRPSHFRPGDRTKAIDALFARRGGVGRKIYTSEEDIKAKLRNVWWWEHFE